MQKYFIAFLPFFLFLSGCASVNDGGGSGKKFMGGEIFLTSLFDSGMWEPETKSISAVFQNIENASVSKKSRNEITAFVSEILTHEDYEISCEFFFKAGGGKDEWKLLEKRAENIKKILIKNGIDKDKINMKGFSALENGAPADACTVVIEAQVW
ncbi:MAG: hypothetical protein LBQ47_01645 [Endomicrobium sp.]|jgi:hypothetical protein|nr:hypothetical protein [Endomicrobium sp.]